MTMRLPVPLGAESKLTQDGLLEIDQEQLGAAEMETTPYPPVHGNRPSIGVNDTLQSPAGSGWGSVGVGGGRVGVGVGGGGIGVGVGAAATTGVVSVPLCASENAAPFTMIVPLRVAAPN